jgi:hypothetical protein
MKKETLLILIYTGVVAALVISIKLAQACTAPDQPVHNTLVADCGDPTPGPGAGE